MGCFFIPKNKSKVAASQQSEQNNSKGQHHGSKLEHMLSSNKPLVLPDPDHFSGEQPARPGSLPATSGLRRFKSGKERGNFNNLAKGINSSPRLINHHPRALSAPVSFPSPISYEDPLPVSGALAVPFSAPLSSSRPGLEHSSSPASSPTTNFGSPLCCGSVAIGVSSSELKPERRVPGKKPHNDKKEAFGGRPARLPKPQTAAISPNGHRLPHPPEIDESSTPIGRPLMVSPDSVPVPSANRTSHGFRALAKGGGVNFVEAMPLPPPALPTESGTPVRAFPFSELAHSLEPECFLGDGVFGSAYRCSVDGLDNHGGKKKIEVAVVCPAVKALQGLREWMAEVNWLARLQDPHICRLMGYCAEDVSGVGSKRLLVYEFLCNGSLDNFVRGKEGSRRLDWATRMRVSLDVAQGLAYLHDKAPFQVICRDLSSPSIQLDEDLRAKLSGFGMARCGPEGDQGPPMVGPYVAPESGSNGLVTIKSNAWSFGIVLLELLTGRRHMDPSFPSGQQNLVQLTKPFLRDEGKLFLIMDPELNGRYSARGALKVANLAFQCLMKEASLRPNLSEVVDSLKAVQTDEEVAVTADLKKSRSLTQSVGSPVYTRSTSDVFVQRGDYKSILSSSLTSVTSSPGSEAKQRDREFLKLAALGSSSSPSYFESRLSSEAKLQKSVFSDRDAQKIPMHHSKQQLDMRQVEPEKLATQHLCEATLSSPLGDNKQWGYRMVPVSPEFPKPMHSDSRQCSSPLHHQAQEIKKQWPRKLSGPILEAETKQQIHMAMKSVRANSHEAKQSSEFKQQEQEVPKVLIPQTTGSSQYYEAKYHSPEKWKSTTAHSSWPLPPNVGINLEAIVGSRSSPSREHKQGRVDTGSRTPSLPPSGEFKLGTLDIGMYTRSLPPSGEIKQGPSQTAIPA